MEGSNIIQFYGNQMYKNKRKLQIHLAGRFVS
ncbi:MAG: hypothetical protein ACJAV5_000101 [Vicingaceae bacterium]|jgi:hypothetical protein